MSTKKTTKSPCKAQVEQTNTRLEYCLAKLQTTQATVLAREQKANMLEANLEEVRANLREAQQRLLQAQAEVQQSGVRFTDADQARSRAEFQAENERLLRLKAEAQMAQAREEATAAKTSMLNAEMNMHKVFLCACGREGGGGGGGGERERVRE
jgi:chromosome segregation ATPase